MRSSLHLTQSTQRGRQRGQALAEFTIAAAFVLIPLFLMIPLLGKFMDMKATTIQAARYAAWERTVWYGTDKSSDNFKANQKKDDLILSEVQQRFFADSGSTPLQSDPTLTGAVADKPLWHDHTGASMLSTYSADHQTTQTPGTMNVFLDDVKKLANNTLGKVLDTEFRLDMESLYTSRVRLEAAANTPAIRLATGADTSGFTAPSFEMKQVLVANGWSANGPDFVKKQTEALAILSLGSREPVKTAMSIAQTVVGTFVPELDKDSLHLGGELTPEKLDLVPPDRLTASTAPPRPPRETAEQQRQKEIDKQNADRKAMQDLADTLKAKLNALDEAIKTTKNTINSCKIDKKVEFMANSQECHIVTSKGHSENCTWHSNGTWTCGLYTPSPLICTLKEDPPGGPGTSFTPNTDKACNESLDAQIADLQAKLDDPDLQKAIKASDDQLAKNTKCRTEAKTPEEALSACGEDLTTNVAFMKQRKAAYAQRQTFQTKIDELQSQLDAMKKSKNGF